LVARAWEQTYIKSTGKKDKRLAFSSTQPRKSKNLLVVVFPKGKRNVLKIPPFVISGAFSRPELARWPLSEVHPSAGTYTPCKDIKNSLTEENTFGL